MHSPFMEMTSSSSNGGRVYWRHCPPFLIPHNTGIDHRSPSKWIEQRTMSRPLQLDLALYPPTQATVYIQSDTHPWSILDDWDHRHLHRHNAISQNFQIFRVSLFQDRRA